MFIWQHDILRRPEGEGSPPAPSMDEFRNVLAFDPFTPPAKEGSDGGGEEAQTEKPPVQAEGGTPAAPPSPSAPPPTPESQATTEADPLADLRQQVQDFIAKAPQAPATAPAAPPPPPPQEPAKAETAPERPQYKLDVPDSIVEAFESEDRGTRKAAMAALINGVANKLLQDFGQALTGLREELSKKVPEQVLTQVDQRSAFERMKSDLYGSFPELGRVAKASPEMETAIWQQVHRIGTQMQVRDWTPEFRDGVGRLLHLQLGVPVAQGQGQAPPAKPPKKQPPFSAGSSGGGRPANGVTPADDFASVLNAGH